MYKAFPSISWIEVRVTFRWRHLYPIHRLPCFVQGVMYRVHTRMVRGHCVCRVHVQTMILDGEWNRLKELLYGFKDIALSFLFIGHEFHDNGVCLVSLDCHKQFPYKISIMETEFSTSCLNCFITFYTKPISGNADSTCFPWHVIQTICHPMKFNDRKYGLPTWDFCKCSRDYYTRLKWDMNSVIGVIGIQSSARSRTRALRQT